MESQRKLSRSHLQESEYCRIFFFVLCFILLNFNNQLLTFAISVAKYIVESTLLPKSASRERMFRVPGGLYSWKEVINTISRTQGVVYHSTYLPVKDAYGLAAKYAASGDVDQELGYSLKAIKCEPESVGVPMTWDNIETTASRDDSRSNLDDH